MSQSRRLILVAAFVLCTFAGCLSLGGTIVHESPETSSRLDSLEARVSSLEQTLGGNR